MFDREEWLARAMKSPQATATRKVFRACKRAGDPVVSVWDGEDDNPVSTETGAMEVVVSVEFSRLYLESGASILVVGGNESETDCIADWSAKDDAGLDAIETIVDSAKLKD